jgi:hypothetical protein
MTTEQYLKKLPHWKRPSPKNKYRHNEWRVACIVFGFDYKLTRVGACPAPAPVDDWAKAKALSRQPRPYDDTLVGYWLQACDVTDMNYTGCRSGDKAKKNVNTWGKA